MDLTERPDEKLAEEAAAGDRVAFEDLVRRFGGAVLGLAQKQVGEHHQANDVTQEIWLKVYRAIGRYQPSGSFRSWLFSITLNHLRDCRRQAARNKVVYIEDYRTATAPGHFDPRGRTEERAAIESALDRVPEPFRTALTLVDVMNLSYEEAAGSLDCAVGTVKSRVNRGRFAFRDQYLKSNEDPSDRVPHTDSNGTV